METNIKDIYRKLGKMHAGGGTQLYFCPVCNRITAEGYNLCINCVDEFMTNDDIKKKLISGDLSHEIYTKIINIIKRRDLLSDF